MDTTVEELLCSGGFEIMHKGKKAGFLSPRYIGKTVVPSMMNYLHSAGCVLDLMFGIDLTSNNGGPGELDAEGSLHRLDPDGGHNEYQNMLHR